ncbi:MAG: hypothetical protein KDB48_00345 [Solirubrobacterales bacterium]|nr:hypothetical protein [Solirubrobacterales bacterium]
MEFTSYKRFTGSLKPSATLTLLVAGFLLLLLVTVGSGFPFGEASAESTRRVVLGASKHNVTPNCGTKAGPRSCFAEGNVTAYQVFQRGHRGRSFVVPYARGKVVSWSISLSNPTRKASQRFGDAQTPYFNNLFGSPSTARISILRQVNKGRKGNPRFRLIRQSGLQRLNRYFGTTVRFALTEPLNVIRGDVVALTIPTWAPAFWVPFACSASPTGGVVNPSRCRAAQKNNTWRGSRSSELCLIGVDRFDRPNEALAKSRPQQKVGTVRRYGCYYDAARLLYSATVVGR